MGAMGRRTGTHRKSGNARYGWCWSTRASTRSQWPAIESIAAKIGCTAETLRHWVRQAERDAHLRPGLTTDERQRLKDLEREKRELKRTNEILKLASEFFAKAELGRRAK
jgi:transposase